MSGVVSLKDAAARNEYGGKAASLSKLLSAGLPVPSGFAVGTNAFQGETLSIAAREAIGDLLKKSKRYAVRSSATSEDAEDASWAGQFETFLDVEARDVPAAVDRCHNSTKTRARVYAEEMAGAAKSNIAVVVQEMLAPDYAGVLFTRNPLTGAKEFVIEYVRGIGEELVSGRVDPERIVVKETLEGHAPFDVKELIRLAEKAEAAFGAPQDIEFASEGHAVWLLQSRAITTLPVPDAFDIGEPHELFYWGPSRTEPLFMSDFMVAVGEAFQEQFMNPEWPNPPKTIVLFHEHQMVWLSNSKDFNEYAAAAFEKYLRSQNVAKDSAEWRSLSEEIDVARSDVFQRLVAAWKATIPAEFSLYGAETVINRMLARLTEKERQDVWQEFTLPDEPGFLQRIDNEILAGESVETLSSKYSWIQDGYFGVTNNAAQYFERRQKEIAGKPPSRVGNAQSRSKLARKLSLSEDEIKALDLARDLAKFMDDRKAWMMRTRAALAHVDKNPGPCDGWLYDAGSIKLFDSKKARSLWKKHVDYKAAREDLKGTVASKAEEDIIEGEVVVVDSPNTAVDGQKILVAPSTSPSYVPLMRNAKALITNHGGMMSHAAIVAREFGLPCIVGTKTATKLLRTGDRIAMDLVSGSIQRIS